MFTYTEPSFDFKAPRAFATRANQSVPNNLEYRTEFMRDRDRILYCNSFRRLAGKTQIYRTGVDDHRRNRLSHTLEVSQIARTIAKALKLNEDLTEAIALGHDLGHTPFGHAGEQILHEIMVPNSKVNLKDSPMQLPLVADTTRVSDLQTKFLFGFKHNLQSVRVVATLEDGYGDCGLNLTNFTLWGIEHHSSLCYKAGRVLVEDKYLEPNYKEIYKNRLYLKGSTSNEAWSFEASVVAIADEIAQWHHDLEDALHSGAMSPEEVCELIKKSLLRDQENFAEEHQKLNIIEKHHQVTKSDLTTLSQIVINFFVNRIIECSIANLELLQKDLDEKRETFKEFLCKHAYTEDGIKNAISLNKIEGNEEDMAKAGTAFAEAISEKIHHSSEVERMNAKGQYIVKKLFQAYYAHPQQLPDNIIIHYVIEARKHIESLRLDISNNDKLQNISAFTTLEVARNAGIGAVRLGLAKMMENQDAFDPYNKILLMRFICDHIANMTDHYAIQEYSLLYA